MPKIYALNAAINDLRSRYSAEGQSREALDRITSLYTKKGWSWEKRLDAVKGELEQSAGTLDQNALLSLYRLNRGVVSRYYGIDAGRGNDWRIGEDGNAYLHRALTYCVGKVKNAAYVQEQLGDLTDMIKDFYKSKKPVDALKPVLIEAEEREAEPVNPAPAPIEPPAPVPEPVFVGETYDDYTPVAVTDPQPVPQEVAPLEELVQSEPAAPVVIDMPCPAPKKENFLCRLFDKYVAPYEQQLRERHPEEAAYTDYAVVRAQTAAVEGSMWVWKLGRALGF